VYDEHNLLAFESEFCVAVLGRGSEYLLISTTEPIDEDLCEQAALRGFCYSGIFGVIRGQIRAKCQDAESIPTMMAAAGEFAQLVADRLKAKRNASGGDFEGWAWRLWELPDTRPEV
jgi:hypothetical protein